MVKKRVKAESELKSIARIISERITIRDYNNGTSKDVTRATTTVEKEIIFKIAYGALLAYSWRETNAAECVLDVAEYTIDQFIPECNGYYTMYTPLRIAIENWENPSFDFNEWAKEWYKEVA